MATQKMAMESAEKMGSDLRKEMDKMEQSLKSDLLSAGSRTWRKSSGDDVPNQYELQFKVVGIEDNEKETDLELADLIQSTIVSILDNNADYKNKQGDKLRFTITKAHRLGRFGASGERPRPVKITVSSSLDANSIIRNRHFLKGSGVCICDYMSPEELKRHKDLKPEFLKAKADPANKVRFYRGNLTVNGQKVTSPKATTSS